MQSRRNFIGKVASGLAGTLAASNVLGANERIRIGIIGPGARGSEILREAVSLPNVECIGAADVYTRRLEDVKKIAPNAKTYLDYRHLLEDRDVDAVLIATPQHLHCEHFTAALDAGKHVYQEKTMAFTVDHAKRMRAAVEHAGSGRAVQIGHQWSSTGAVADAVSFLKSDLMGKVTAIDAHMYRNTPHGKPQWARPVYPDMTPENIVWQLLPGRCPAARVRPQSLHQLALLLGLFRRQRLREHVPPDRLLVQGDEPEDSHRGHHDRRPVPVEGRPRSARYHERRDGAFRRADVQLELRLRQRFAGRHRSRCWATTARISHTPQSIRYAPQKVNRRDGNEMLGATRNQRAGHMDNFLDSIRGTATPNCPFDLGFRVAIACRMAVESYRRERTVRWDAAKEEIV